MAKKYQYTSTGYPCPESPYNMPQPGWYDDAGNLIQTGYINPATGSPWTAAELGGGAATTTSTGTPTSTGVQDVSGLPASLEGGWTTSSQYSDELVSQMLSEGTMPSAGIAWGVEGAPTIQQLLSGQYPQVGQSPTGAVPLPTFGDVNVPAPTVTPAPPFEKSEAQLAWEEGYGGDLTAWREAGGYGIPEETQALMTQQLTDTLKAKETEDIRVMRNNMERRGITNSGFVFSNEQKIRSGTTMALAKSITDIKIQSALMKMASFEKAMGATALFLGYLSEQSQLQYQPTFQTWQAQQQANLYQYQAKMDLYKIQLQQAYTQQNMILAGNIQADAAAQQNIWDVEMLEMEIEASQQAAAAEGWGNFFGTLLMLPFMFM